MAEDFYTASICYILLPARQKNRLLKQKYRYVKHRQGQKKCATSMWKAQSIGPHGHTIQIIGAQVARVRSQQVAKERILMSWCQPRHMAKFGNFEPW